VNDSKVEQFDALLLVRIGTCDDDQRGLSELRLTGMCGTPAGM
jgi:hypothetical protein